MSVHHTLALTAMFLHHTLALTAMSLHHTLVLTAMSLHHTLALTAMSLHHTLALTDYPPCNSHSSAVRRYSFDPQAVGMGFVADKVTLGQVFSEHFRFTLSVSFHQFP